MDVLFEFHLKFWNTTSIGIPARSLLGGRQTSGLTTQQKGTTARWYSNKTFLLMIIFPIAQIKSMFVYITLTQSLHKEAYVFCMPFSFYF